MAEPADTLERWSVATFDVVAFGLVAVLAGHASGGLAGVLPGIGTVPGALAFFYLWALVLAATRWVFAEGGLDRTVEGEWGALALRGVSGGAAVGFLFAGGSVLVAGLVVELSDATGDFVAVAYVALVGAAIGAIVGAALGAIFAFVNAGLYRATDAFVPRRTE